ncbi:MAG TPA: hypothetical protein VGP93_09915 [Polyangiaceae bacterium]|nr:hypothetical protein [Polyangiaceae bacterium]
MPDLEEGIPDTRLGNAVVAIRATLNDPTVQHRVGELWLRTFDQQRRIVWCIRPSHIERPFKTTGGAFTSGAEAERSTPARVRHESVQAYIQAEDQTTTELLLDNLLAALDNTFADLAEPSDYEWETQQRPGSTVDQGGAGYSLWAERIRLDITFEWLVLKEISPLAIMTAVECDDCGL